MQENKYFYKGIPISEYCKDNNLNVQHIRTAIWKKRKSKKYENYSDQEIIDMVIETYKTNPNGNNRKYYYKGVPLKEYYKDNENEYRIIISRINSLRKKDPSLSNDELVIQSIEQFVNNNFRFFYKGIPLKKYCKENNINYETIRNYINREQERNKNLSDEEAIEQYLKKEHKGIYKYYYCGIPLRKYCKENNINYKNIIGYIGYHKNEYIGLSDDELIELVMNQYKPFEPKYMYKGITLSRYCAENDLSYYSVITYVKRKIERGSTKTIDELIEEGINTINRYGIIYYYNGIPLKDYCAENDINVKAIRSSIIRKQVKSLKPLQEIINQCVETYQKFSRKYYYEGIPLTEFCEKIGLNYKTVISKYLTEYSDKDVNESIKEIVDYYIENPPTRIKYYVDDQSLTSFCDKNGYPYISIYNRIKTLKNNNEENIVEKAIKKYEDRLEIDKINKIFIKLKKGQIKDINKIKDICNTLKIDFENVTDLVNMDFSYNQAINMIWYFSDKKINDNKIITDKKLEEVLQKVNNIDELELYDLIGIYKSELYDSRSKIILKLKKYIYKNLYTLTKNYEITVNKNNYEDFESEIKYYILLVINRTSLNNIGQIIKYMDMTVKGYFRSYLKKYKENIHISLNESKYIDDRGTSKEKQKIDYVADSNNSYEEKESFNLDFMKVLKELPEEDLTFIVLKYKEDYSDEELSNYFGLTIEKVKEKDLRILELLKDNDDIKVFKKIVEI